MPVSTTLVPAVPLVGLKPEITGAGMVTVKGNPLLTPAGVVTTTLPVVAPVGTVAVICVAEFTVNVAVVPLNVTLVAPVRLVPVIATVVMAVPLVGLRVLSAGSGAVTMKGKPLLGPLSVVTTTLPVVAPAGTLVVICVAEFTVNVAVVPLSVTPVAPARLAPVSTTVVPAVPAVGLSALMVGAGVVTVKARPLLVPPGVVTVTLPVLAPAGTVAVICVPAFTVNAAAAPLKLTVVAPVKLVPVSTTLVPAVPLVGLRLLIVGPATAPEIVKLVLEILKK